MAQTGTRQPKGKMRDGLIAKRAGSGENGAERTKAMREIESLAEFPAENPNPVFRVATDGTILYANQASAGLLVSWSCRQGEVLPDPWRGLVLETWKSGTTGIREVCCGTRVYSLTFTPVGQREYVNIYGLEITERKRAEEVLQQSEEQYRTLAANLPGIVYRIHLKEDNRIQFFNDQLPALTGYTGDELSAGEVCPIDPLIHEDDRPKVISAVRQAIADHGSFTVEYRLIHKDGSERCFIERARVIENADRQLFFIDGLIHDITERKRAMMELQESEKRYRSLFKNMLNGFAYCRMLFDGDRPRDFIYLDVNSAFEALTGLKDVVGKRVSEVIPGIRESDPQLFEIYGRVALTGKPERFEIYVEALKMWFSISVYSPRREHFVAVFDVITARKQAEKERETTIGLLHLLNAGNNTRGLIQSVLLFLQDWSGCEAVGIRLRDGNDYPYYETRGFPPQFVEAENTLCIKDLRGQFLRDDVGNPVLECMCGNILCGRFDPSKPFFTAQGSFWTNCTTELLAGTTEADRQGLTRNRCNGEGYESVALIPLRAAGATFGLLQMNDRKRGRFTPEIIALAERLGDSLGNGLAQRMAEEAAARAQQAMLEQQRSEKDRVEADLARAREELIRTIRLATIGQVSASIAHDLRNPLGAVRNASFLLKRHFPQGAHPLDLLKIIDQEVSRADQIITRLLVMARTQTPHKQKIDLGQTIAAVFGRIGGVDQVHLVLSMKPDPFWVHADPVELDLVISNLLINAAHAMSGKGTLSVEAIHDDGEDRIVFHDTGPGIAPEIMDTLFDPLVTTKSNGTGLGLTICRQIVGKHGGTIQAANAPDGGAVFTIRLPQV